MHEEGQARACVAKLYASNTSHKSTPWWIYIILKRISVLSFQPGLFISRSIIATAFSLSARTDN
jgi:hypothetical protein